MTETDLLDALERYIERSRPCLMAREVTIGTRRADAVMIHGAALVGIEAKANRASFRRDTEAKRTPTRLACHGAVYLAPVGVIEPERLPPDWGLWEVDGAEVVVRVPIQWSEPDLTFQASLARTLVERSAVHERRARDPLDPEWARAEIDRLSGMVATRQATVERLRGSAPTKR